MEHPLVGSPCSRILEGTESDVDLPILLTLNALFTMKRFHTLFVDTKNAHSTGTLTTRFFLNFVLGKFPCNMGVYIIQNNAGNMSIQTANTNPFLLVFTR